MWDKITSYSEAFKKLRTDRNRKRWSSLTAHRAPHKPLLLLAILDHVDRRILTDNLINPDFELVETFSRYWARIMPLGTSGNLAYPFFHLASEPFWHLVPRPEATFLAGKTITSVKLIREMYLGAKLDASLFQLLLEEPFRNHLRETLITTYFAPEVQPLLRQQGEINRDAFDYSRKLLLTSEPETREYVAEDQIDDRLNKVRDQGFRRAIVNLYEHRCSMCGIRMMTPTGHTVVEAAHIEPWSVSQNDRPTNGLALCRLCHWSFDEGLMTVGKDYEVKVSKTVRQDNNYPGHILTLSDRPIFKPAQDNHWPAQENLDYHRKKIFIR